MILDYDDELPLFGNVPLLLGLPLLFTELKCLLSLLLVSQSVCDTSLGAQLNSLVKSPRFAAPANRHTSFAAAGKRNSL